MSDDAKRKIAALLKLTRKAGCSEAEAIAAAEKAAQLMLEHGLSEADVLYTTAAAKAKTAGRGIRDRLWGAVSINTNTALIFMDGTATFVGQGPGPAIAAYLFAVLNRAIDREIAGYKATANYKRRRTNPSRRRAVQDFTDAMVFRLREKIYDMFAAVRSETACRAALVARNAMYPNSHSVTPLLAKRRNSIAATMGFMAGDSVELSHGVGGQSGGLQIAQ